MLIVSHDRYFLNKVINKIVELKENGMNEYLGNYNYYIEKKENPTRFKEFEDFSNGKTKTQIKEEKKKVKLAQKEIRIKRTRLREIESEISNSEELLEKLNNDLCLEEIYSNPKESERVNKEISETEAKIESLYEEWEILSEELNND